MVPVDSRISGMKKKLMSWNVRIENYRFINVLQLQTSGGIARDWRPLCE